MAGSSSSMNMLVVMALVAVILACGLVSVHMHPEYVESVKNWYCPHWAACRVSETARLPATRPRPPPYPYLVTQDVFIFSALLAASRRP